jgi:hypothetical protein
MDQPYGLDAVTRRIGQAARIYIVGHPSQDAATALVGRFLDIVTASIAQALKGLGVELGEHEVACGGVVPELAMAAIIPEPAVKLVGASRTGRSYIEGRAKLCRPRPGDGNATHRGLLHPKLRLRVPQPLQVGESDEVEDGALAPRQLLQRLREAGQAMLRLQRLDHPFVLLRLVKR